MFGKAELDKTHMASNEPCQVSLMLSRMFSDSCQSRVLMYTVFSRMKVEWIILLS